MWSSLALCLFVGLAYASTTPAWENDKEYVYSVNGRTLSSLHETADHYSGIFLKAKLSVSLLINGKLQGKIVDPQYAQIQTQLPDGWQSEIPESQLSYQGLKLSQKPFQIELENGLVKNLIVEKEVTNWEANIIRSFVSQFQLDIQGNNAINSSMNNFPSEDHMNGVFKTMEETVTGKCETLYQIRRLPEYLIQSQPWLAPQDELRSDKEVIEISKFKNYSNAEDMLSYHYGFGHVVDNEPASNKMGQFFIRESNSRVIVTGKLSRYTIQNTYTVNKIMMNPIFKNQQMGSVISMINMTLDQLNPSAAPQELSDPVELDLDYAFETSYSGKHGHQQWKGHMNDQESSEESNEQQRNRPRGISMAISKQQKQRSSEESNSRSPRLSLSQAPNSPLLPYLVGYFGKSIRENKDFDIKENVQTIVKQISAELTDAAKILSESTLNKYVILNKLVRMMTADEIKSVAEQLYPQDQQDESRRTWAVFRDSVAEAGTGPAFLTIQEWIQTKKIEEREAASVIETMANAVRAPTEEYMSQFFEIVKSSDVQKQDYLNETSLLAYTNLIYRVYGTKYESHNQYPVHAYGNFNTRDGREFVETTVIPFLARQLKYYVSESDARKIHVYTRALANIGHQQILKEFEPYLEGKSQISQFQRMWMVWSLDRLVRSHPQSAQSVLYKMYQNNAELPEIRTVAAYLVIAKTNPPAEMLQHMAQYTNVDAQEEVNAAIKSALLAAAKLEAPQYKELRENAQSAVPLLTRKQYGTQESYLELRDYIVKHIGFESHQFLEVGSPDSFVPKALNFDLQQKMHGMNYEDLTVRGVVSSIRDLTNVLWRQTQKSRQEQEDRSKNNNSDKTWSSSNVSQWLKYQQQRREQLEAVIYGEIEYVQKLWSFDNQTVERLPEIVRQQEELLRQGKQFNYVKLWQLKEMALSFPTEMGLPFLYTYDVPIIINCQGQVKAQATPQISSNNLLNEPEAITVDITSDVTFSSAIQSQLSFVTPFDHQVYMAGYDRNFQLHAPVQATAEINIKNKEMKIQFEVNDKGDESRLLHISSSPYVSRDDIMTIKPVALRENTYVIKPQVDQHRFFDATLGKKQTGLSFRVWGHYPVQTLNINELTKLWKSEGVLTMWDYLWTNARMEYTEANVAFEPNQSSTNKVTLHLKYDEQDRQQPEVQDDEAIWTWKQLQSILQVDNTEQRQQQTMKHIGSGIKSAHLDSLDISVEFEGGEKHQHVCGYAFAKSNSDALSKSLIYYNNEEGNPFAFEAKANVPNTNGLDLTQSLSTKPSADYTYQLQYAQSNNIAKVSSTFQLTRSDRRTNYLINKEPMYRVCKEQMQQGNFQLAACQNMTIRANFLDNIKYNVQFENVNKQVVNYVDDTLKALIIYYYPMVEVSSIESEGDNKVTGEIQFQPEDFRQVNVTIESDGQRVRFYNISAGGEFAKAILVPHPVFHLRSRVSAVALGHKNFRPTCVIDQTAAQTFNNRTYPLTLNQDYSVVLQYIPKDAPVDENDENQSVQDQLKQQVENYIVLARKTSEKQKEILLSLNHPKTQGKTVEIKLEPSQTSRNQRKMTPAAKVTVDGESAEFDDKQSADYFNGLIEIYALPNGEVKLEVQRAFYLIFDGQRVKITATTGKLRDSIMGLCGQFNNDQFEDFTVPAKCIVRSPEEFFKRYNADNQQNRQQRSGEYQSDCVYKVLPLYINAVSDNDVARTQSLHQRQQNSGTKLRTRYVEQNREICFTIRPVAQCNGTARKTVTKNVSVHCIEGTKTAYYWKLQIDQGGNPDFSNKSETKTIPMELPLQCN
ncbi:hypothetical protein ABEB36_011424 [Hypothenemus hampei]|uniref:Vitellogenin n=1 Tax=Hypothenemus hampei TaxID=57062 RepID=A0ABD1EFM2_HYPHA